MLTYPFLIIQKRLIDTVPPLREVDWYMNQDSESDKDKSAPLKSMPAAFIQFLPFDTQDMAIRIQQAVVEFEIILLSDCVFDNGKKRMQKDNASDHMRLFDAVHSSLGGFSSLISFLPDFSALQNTASDQRIMNTISRVGVTPPHIPRKAQMKSVQRFRTVLYDHGAFKTFTSANPALEVSATVSVPGS